jgi:hypothetical protein
LFRSALMTARPALPGAAFSYGRNGS